jgi:ubiquinone/menaquinone biosynthesis C-methylase UbiE
MDKKPPKVFYEIFNGLPRQGPGSAEATARAFHMVALPEHKPHIVDVGCGTGAQTLNLARLAPHADITAIDNHQPFLDALEQQFEEHGFSDRLITANEPMEDLPFEDDAMDLLWCEGAIYIMGVKKALDEWKRFIKPGGYIAFSEACWLKPGAPAPVADFWNAEYPDITFADQILELIAECGYRSVGRFALPASAWVDDYYNPLQENVNRLRNKYAGNEAALQIIEMTQREIDIFHEYSEWYGYVFFVAQKTD